MKARRPSGKEAVGVVVVGVGHLGKEHARILRDLDGSRLEGVVDLDEARGREVAARLGVKHYFEITPDLLASVHAASIVTPTPTHFDVARQCIDAGISVLVEKPMTSDVAEARELVARAEEQGVTLQVGHIERFNPVVLAAYPYVRDPAFIECDRIHPFSFRSVETSVVLDLMIHDIDIVLNLVNSPVAELDAVGVHVLSETEDLAYARLTFENGCTSVVKASRVAIQKSRKMRIFCRESYISLDYIAKTGMKLSLREGFDPRSVDFRELGKLEETQGAYPIFTRYFNIEQLAVAAEEPLRNELESFLLAVRTGRPPVVTGRHGLEAIEIATRIQEDILRHQAEFLARRHGLPRSSPQSPDP
jgi:predicted dehydrogenase